MGGAQAVQVLEGLLAQGGPSGTPGFRIDLAQEEDGTIGVSVAGRSFSIVPQSSQLSSPSQNVTTEYTPKPTLHRWQEEMAIVPLGSNETLGRLVAHIVNRLLPSARQRAEVEAERIKRVQKEAADTAALKEDTVEPARMIDLPGPLASPQTVAAALIEDVEMGESPYSRLMISDSTCQSPLT